MSGVRKIIASGLALAAIGCGPRPLVSDDYKTETPRQAGRPGSQLSVSGVHRRRLQRNSPDAIDKYFSPSVVVHSVAPGCRGRQRNRVLFEGAREELDHGFPDLT